MPKSQIIIDAVNGDCPIEKVLRQAQLLAHDFHNAELQQWAENEINGYSVDDVLPNYRIVRSADLSYTGFNNILQINGASLPIKCLSKDTFETISKVSLTEDICSIEDLAQSERGGSRDLTVLADEVYRQSQGQIQCLTINQLVPSSCYRKVVAEVRSRAIKALLILEEQHGKLDKMSFRVSAAKASDGNRELNSALGLPGSEADGEPLRSKIAWKIVAPIITAVMGAVLTTLAYRWLGLH